MAVGRQYLADKRYRGVSSVFKSYTVGRQSFADNHFSGKSMPKYKRYHLPHHPVFVTIVTHHRQNWIVDHHVEIFDSLRAVKMKYGYRHLAHVLLPDHLHWMFLPDEGVGFSSLVAAFKRHVTWTLKRRDITVAWQKRFYDHVIRNPHDYQCHLDYIHYNPVKHGMATRASDYEYSSFKEWLRRGVYDEGWGEVEPRYLRDMQLE